ncbi:MAG: hypothetical protein LBM93_03695 [Oscillospiraceae bacterium]|jgi:hypothetical protein|nr:hypothetical protein [Oscillospiraceae bacterium]
MKKLLILFIIFLNVINISAVSVTEIAEVESDYNVVQGTCKYGRFFYYAKVQNNSVELHKRRVSEPTTDILCVSETSDTKYPMNHANDMTYDRKNNRLIVNSYKDNDETTKGLLTFVSPDTLVAYGSVVAKDKDGNPLAVTGLEYYNGNYIAISNNIYLLDENFQEIERHSRGDFSHNILTEKYKKIFGEGHLSTQGVAIDKNYIYYLLPYYYNGKYYNFAVRFNFQYEPIDEFVFNMEDEAQGLFFSGSTGYVITNNQDRIYKFYTSPFSSLLNSFDTIRSLLTNFKIN